MIDAKKAKTITEKYYENKTNVNGYLLEIDKLIEKAAQKGGTFIIYDFSKLDLSVAEMNYAKRKVSEALHQDYGYRIIHDLFSIEICW